MVIDRTDDRFSRNKMFSSFRTRIMPGRGRGKKCVGWNGGEGRLAINGWDINGERKR